MWWNSCCLSACWCWGGLKGIPFSARELRAPWQAGPGIESSFKALLGAFVEQYFVEGFFHADPHPSNIKVLPNGTLILFVAGMVAQFDPRTLPISWISFWR
ncbi:MAG: AarF/UbiB family protein [Cyanobacteriota bacterium]|nr:AarF/UbiB family protein [Cyanobacteriota bacterium]